MKEQKIMSFTQPGYRLQLLKITETNVNGYFQIRENRKIKSTFTTLDTAVRKFYALQGSKILQKDLFSNNEELNKDEIKMQGVYEDGGEWTYTIPIKKWREFIRWNANK